MIVDATHNEAALHVLGAQIVREIRDVNGNLTGYDVQPDVDLSGYAATAASANKVSLKACSATARFVRETGGIVVSGVSMPTDRTTQASLMGAYAYTQQNPAATFRWKLADGSFQTLGAAQIAAIAAAVAAHVQACFAAEGDLSVGIDAGTITTAAQIDSAFANVTPSPLAPRRALTHLQPIGTEKCLMSSRTAAARRRPLNPTPSAVLFSR